MSDLIQTELPGVIQQFNFFGRYKSALPYGMGHINDTFKVIFENGNDCENHYILQRINHHVFIHPREVMSNIQLVTDHLRKKVVEQGGDPSRETLNLIKTHDGNTLFCTEAGNYWRAYHFLNSTCSYQVPEKTEHVNNAGYAFGNFLRLLADFPTNKLVDTIPEFHNTFKRYQTFLQVLKADTHARVKDVPNEICFLLERADDMAVLVNAFEQGSLPERVTHNDTKFNNVMIDVETGKGICVIDLDTVMPGLALYDFGDAIRSITNTGEEDEPDLTKVHFNLDYFRHFTEGFASATCGILTEKEVEYLPFSAKLITMEIGMRFLTDYLDGDNYFKIDYPVHNLDRCRTQFRLVEEMEEQMEAMTGIVESFYRS